MGNKKGNGKLSWIDEVSKGKTPLARKVVEKEQQRGRVQKVTTHRKTPASAVQGIVKRSSSAPAGKRGVGDTLQDPSIEEKSVRGGNAGGKAVDFYHPADDKEKRGGEDLGEFESEQITYAGQRIVKGEETEEEPETPTTKESNKINNFLQEESKGRSLEMSDPRFQFNAVLSRRGIKEP